MGQQGVGDAGSPVSIRNTSSGSDSGDEPGDEFDSDYDPLWDEVDL